jgi:hypothetical protein
MKASELNKKQDKKPAPKASGTIGEKRSLAKENLTVVKEALNKYRKSAL